MSTKSHILLVLCLSVVLFSHHAFAEEKANHALPGADFWIGEVGPSGPLFTGPHQYPFICTTLDNGLGQPLVDNQDGIGNAVFPEVNGIPVFTSEPVGNSKNCGVTTRIDYFYFSQSARKFLPLPDPANVPADVEKISIQGKTVNFVVRLERGTINRFIYGIAMLAPFKESLEKPESLNNSAWNHKLVYKFQGGVGIGHWQGKFALSREQALHYESLKLGYAVAYSTGTITSTHYNLKLAEETALMVKLHFKNVYGNPEYTVGLGGSGGAIQQYVIGQNNRDIIDAAIPQMSYPDMITQTIHVPDYELLERYFDEEYRLNPQSRWKDWSQRALIEGMVANNIAIQKPWGKSPFSPAPGSNEYVNGWRGTVQAVFNPAWTHALYYEALKRYRYPPLVIANIKWSHWNDLGNIYPQDKNGVAYNTWDNVGVQYGLQALLNGDISAQEFLEINACAGGWKPSQEMVLGNFPWNPNASPLTLDPWDTLNMNLSPLCKLGQPAPRTAGNLLSMNTAYTSGQVFTGELRIPIIDLRWYLEPVLNMHHSQASFASRARMINQQGDARNQIIWFAECSELDPRYLKKDCAYNPTGDALGVIDQWMTNIKNNAEKGIADNKPKAAIDTCFNGDGSVLYAGADAWDGILNNKPAGPCTTAFPVYSDTRRTAGGPISGDIFKCALKSVDHAIADGSYGDVVFSEAQRNLLKTIYPTGVCDYSKPDTSKPLKDVTGSK